MKFSFSGSFSLRRKMPPQFLKAMKLTATFLLIFFLQLSAEGLSQITLSVKNATVEKVFREVERQTGVGFLYTKGTVKNLPRVTLNVKDASIEEILNDCFKGQAVRYTFDNNTIVINRKIRQNTSILNHQKDHRQVLSARPPLEVHGKVVDQLGNPLEGVSIIIRSTSSGTVSDNNGMFLINVEPTDTIEVSLVGYESQRLPVRNQVDMMITLKGKEGSLNEVVVVAYGKQKKASVTAAISSIDTREIKQSPAANLTQTLAGRLPGLIDMQRSGQPGQDLSQLFIRGRGTTNEQNPIILVDGVERDLNYLDPNEVESVTILKDASATALYGVRGANGVILVTTKRGESEIPEINFTAEAGGQAFTRTPKIVNSYDYATLRNLTLENDGLGPFAEFSPEELQHYKDQDDPIHYGNTDLYKEMLKTYAPQNRYNLNISGLGKRVGYFVNAGYLHQGGQFKAEKGMEYDPSFKLDRYNFRSNIDININSSLKAYLNVAGYLEKQNMPNAIGTRNNISNFRSSSAAQILASMLRPAVITGLVVPPGHGDTSNQVIARPGEIEPAYGKMNRAGYVDQTESNVTATYGMHQELDFLTKGLSIEAIMSFDAQSINAMMASRDYETYYQEVDYNNLDANGEPTIKYLRNGTRENTPLSIVGSRYFSTFTNFQGNINYQRNFGDHSFTGLVLFQRQKRIINEELPYNLIGMASRLSYGYKDKYFLEFNAGYNGSEQFAPKNRFGFFPAISGAWVVSKEKFWGDGDIFSYLKLRASYGEVGNDRLGSARFLYLDNMEFVSIPARSGGASQSLGDGRGVLIQRLKNDALQWEVAKKLNLGMELGILNNLTINFDYFHEKRNNILRNRGTTPILLGISSSTVPPINLGVIENQGFELELGYNKSFNRDVALIAKANMSYAKNKVLFVDEPVLPKDYAYTTRETGFQIGQQWGYIVEGYFVNEKQIEESPIQNVGGRPTMPGDFKYKDANGDGVIDEKDLSPLGYPNVPEINFGAAFSLTYKNFDLSVLVQGVGHTSNYYEAYGVFALGNYFDRMNDSWTAEKSKNLEPIRYPRLTALTSPNEIRNSFFIVNNSFIRLKNVELGYHLPTKWSEKIKAKDIRFYFNGFNLITWDRLPTKNFDPEQSSSQSYPLFKVYNLGVNIRF